MKKPKQEVGQVIQLGHRAQRARMRRNAVMRQKTELEVEDRAWRSSLGCRDTFLDFINCQEPSIWGGGSCLAQGVMTRSVYALFLSFLS